MSTTRRFSLVVTVGVCISAVAFVPPASASRPHEFTATFGEPCIAEPCEGAALKEPNGVAVSEATGDVYVVDRGANRVVRFNAAGVFQSEFNGSGLLSGEGKEAGSGSEPGEIKTGRFESPEGIAVDNSCVLRRHADPSLTQAKCEEEDPSNGDLYVVDAAQANAVIDKYTAAGEYVGQITSAGETPLSFRPVQGVAVDPIGTVWVYRLEQEVVDRFTNARQNTFLAPQIGLHGTGDTAVPGGLAVDSEDHIYALHGAGEARAGAAGKWDREGNLLIEALDGTASTGVAVEQNGGNSLVDSGTSIGVFSPEGKQVEHLGDEGGEAHLDRGAGIGVNATTSFVYVAEESGAVVVFGPAQPSAPKVEGESFEGVGDHEATLGAQINPRSEPGETATEYHFQYGRCATATTCASSGYEADVPVPDGHLAPNFEVHAVSAKAEGLSPSTTYHFRVIARNSHGEGASGAEQTFTTEGAGGELILADNRGWELVSPPDKKGALIEPLAETGVIQAAANGDGITYLANAPTEAQPQGYTNKVQVLSRRGSASWSSRDIAIPHSGATGLTGGDGQEYKFFDRELTDSAVQPFGPFIPQLSEEASESTAYLHDLGDSCGSHCFHPLVTGKPGFANVPEGTVFGEASEPKSCTPAAELTSKAVCGPEFLGATEDLSHVVLTEHNASLTAGAAAVVGLYEWSGGTLATVSVLPGGEAVGGSGLGLGETSETARGAISADGSRIAWTAKGNLYLREMTLKQSVQLDAAQAPIGEGAQERAEREERSGGGAFQIASPDGTRVLFTDTNRLTEDSGAKTNEPDLYECRITIEEGELTCVLSDLTPKRGDENAGMQGAILGASADATSVYFVAKGVLSEEPNARGQSALAGQPNLYVRRDGSTQFIATLASEDAYDWNEVLTSQPTRVSANGRYLELMSQAPLTGYDNRDRATGKPVAEVYLYDAETGRLSCASCEPTGMRPVGVEYHKLEQGSGGLAGGFNLWRETALVAANVPGWTASGSGRKVKSRYQARYLTDQGRLFFNSADALVPQDSNGTEDVYEYEPPGVGDCSEAVSTFSARSDGCVSLISSGSSSQESTFIDASESGDDVFFLTSSTLSPIDVDSSRDIYDAHVCSSGSPCISYAASEVPPCTNEASCKPSPTPQPSIFGAPASATFEGPGNPPAAPSKPPVIKTLTRRQKLAKALKACRVKHDRHKRHGCEKQARRKFATTSSKRSKSNPKGKK